MNRIGHEVIIRKKATLVDIFKDYYMTFSISAMESARESHTKTDSELMLVAI
jgi:hypothetical protein